MKLFVKAAALCVISMPLFAAEMTTMNGADCSTMTGEAQTKCMMDMKNNCNGMPSGTQKNDCMKKYDDMMNMINTKNANTGAATTGTNGKNGTMMQ